MIRRRQMIQRATLGGALMALTAPDIKALGTEAAADASSDRATEEVAKAVRAIHDEISRQNSFWEIASVRDATRAFLRANGKFPDFIEVGTDTWQQVYDWHVRFQQPVMVGRTPEGRYTITLMATTLVMRPDLAQGYIGPPYDNR
jgi:hypothetical protein